MRRDVYDNMPEDMKKYLANYGWHFNKKMAEWAVSKMEDRNGNSVQCKESDTLMSTLKANGIDTSGIVGYDAVYVEAMARADFLGSSLQNDLHVLKYVGDYLNDKDGYEGIALTRFYVDCIGKGMPIFWEDMI